MVFYVCEKCSYETNEKRNAIRHANKKRLCRNERIIINKDMANKILAKNEEEVFNNKTYDEVVELLYTSEKK